MTKNEQKLVEYLDRIYRQGDTFESLCGNAWQMFERSVAYPPDIVEQWAKERGILDKLQKSETKPIMEPPND